MRPSPFPLRSFGTKSFFQDGTWRPALGALAIVFAAAACGKGSSEGAPVEAPKPPPPAASDPAPAAPATPTASATPATPASGPLFACELTVAPSHPLGTPVKLHFRLTQRGTQTVYVLNWRTPLEGTRGDNFAVVRDGQEISY